MRFVLTLFLCLAAMSARADDWRAYHHGIGFVPDGKGRYWIFYSGVADPSRDVGDEEEWSHGIYVANWGAGDNKLTPRVFIREKGAQEPVAIAENSGRIFLTAEDGGNTDEEVDQRYGVYDLNLKPVLPYPQQVESGGHSGHVAAVGAFFAVFYSDGWIEGGGVDDLGTGHGVYAKIYDRDGLLVHDVDVAHESREWWPMIAASPGRALLAWQGYIKGRTYARLKIAMLDPVSGEITPAQILRDDLRYYTYNLAFMPALNRFLLVGTSDNSGQGFAYLIDPDGKIAASAEGLPPFVREAGIAVDGKRAFFPVGDRQLARLTATPYAVALDGLAVTPFAWAEEGSVGLPAGAGRWHWVSLDRYGLQEADFNPSSFTSVSGVVSPTQQRAVNP